MIHNLAGWTQYTTWVPRCATFLKFSEWLRTSHYSYKEGTAFRERWELDYTRNLCTKINYDFLDNYLYLHLYPAIQPILISGIICIWLSGKFCYPELSVSDYPANFTIHASLKPLDNPAAVISSYFKPKGATQNLILMESPNSMQPTWTGYSVLGQNTLHLNWSLVLEPTLGTHNIWCSQEVRLQNYGSLLMGPSTQDELGCD